VISAAARATAGQWVWPSGGSVAELGWGHDFAHAADQAQPPGSRSARAALLGAADAPRAGAACGADRWKL